MIRQGRVPTLGRASFRLDMSLRWGQYEGLEMVNPFISEKTGGCLRLRVLELFPHPRFGYLTQEFVICLIMIPYHGAKI